MSDELEKLRAELASARAKEEKAVSAYCVELSMRGTAEAERDKARAELADAHRLLDAARYELRFEGSADLLDRIDAALAKGGGDEL